MPGSTCISKKNYQINEISIAIGLPAMKATIFV
jgi:hypothetical protein